MLTGADRIRKLIPHAGNMCLLERVIVWDAESIQCEARSHLDPHNPLRRNGRLSCICGIEYAAQAMAVHGALRVPAQATRRHGYLASVRDTHCSSASLDEGNFPLVVKARLLLEAESKVIYAFSIDCNGLELISGRAAVVLGKPANG